MKLGFDSIFFIAYGIFTFTMGILNRVVFFGYQLLEMNQEVKIMVGLSI